MTIFQLSPFISSQFNKAPVLNGLLTRPSFDLHQDWQEFQKDHRHLDIFALCRLYRQSRLALIAAKDAQYPQLKEHINTLRLTSQLARLLINHVYQYVIEEITEQHGTVVDTAGKTQEFIIFTLGKLGGMELNYSSDIDLVFCYTGQGKSDGQSDGKRPLDSYSYFQKMGRRIIQILDCTTVDGQVYRVDMRLRPFGSAAPLICSAHHLLNYLETEGRDWERYAWLRAGFIANNHVVARSILKQIEPFIYRKYLDYGIFESLRQIKAQIIRQQSDDVHNLKLGIGGIREIEFIIQTLQLTFGGRNKQLQGHDLWQQMHRLNHYGQLSDEDYHKLSSAWLFLRKLENLCQIINDQDTHHVPDALNGLAQCIHCENQQQFDQQLTEHRENVHHIFTQMFLSNQIESQNHQHPDIQRIKDDISQRSFPKTSKHKIYAALDALVPFLSKKKDNTIDNDVLINRYQQIIYAICKRPSYLSMLIESPVIVNKLVKQMGYGNYFSRSIAKNPTLLETLFDDIEKNDCDVEQQWRIFCQKHNFDNDEHYLNLLCQFKQHMQFTIVMAYTAALHDANTTQKMLTQLAEKILSLVIIQAWQETNKETNTDININDLIVIGYGSLAMSNMHLHSDFDVVFILNQSINDGNHRFIMRWIKRIILLLSIPTYTGSLYQLDTQLRPNGKSGALVISQNNYEQYQRNEAWLWEHAALIKSRAVYATHSQKQWFNTLRKDILSRPRNAKKVDHELNNMAKKMKHMSQKNHQKEFQKLGHILKHTHTHPELLDTVFSEPQDTQHKLDLSIKES